VKGKAYLWGEGGYTFAADERGKIGGLTLTKASVPSLRQRFKSKRVGEGFFTGLRYLRNEGSGLTSFSSACRRVKMKVLDDHPTRRFLLKKGRIRIVHAKVEGKPKEVLR